MSTYAALIIRSRPNYLRNHAQREELLLLDSLREQRHPLETEKRVWYRLRSRLDLNEHAALHSNLPLLADMMTSIYQKRRFRIPGTQGRGNSASSVW